MSTQTIIKATGQSEIHQMLDNLTGILDLELQYSRKFTEVLRCRVAVSYTHLRAHET